MSQSKSTPKIQQMNNRNKPPETNTATTNRAEPMNEKTKQLKLQQLYAKKRQTPKTNATATANAGTLKRKRSNMNAASFATSAVSATAPKRKKTSVTTAAESVRNSNNNTIVGATEAKKIKNTLFKKEDFNCEKTFECQRLEKGPNFQPAIKKDQIFLAGFTREDAYSILAESTKHNSESLIHYNNIVIRLVKHLPHLFVESVYFNLFANNITKICFDSVSKEKPFNEDKYKFYLKNLLLDDFFFRLYFFVKRSCCLNIEVKSNLAEKPYLAPLSQIESEASWVKKFYYKLATFVVSECNGKVVMIEEGHPNYFALVSVIHKYWSYFLDTTDVQQPIRLLYIIMERHKEYSFSKSTNPRLTKSVFDFNIDYFSKGVVELSKYRKTVRTTAHSHIKSQFLYENYLKHFLQRQQYNYLIYLNYLKKSKLVQNSSVIDSIKISKKIGRYSLTPVIDAIDSWISYPSKKFEINLYQNGPDHNPFMFEPYGYIGDSGVKLTDPSIQCHPINKKDKRIKHILPNIVHRYYLPIFGVNDNYENPLLMKHIKDNYIYEYKTYPDVLVEFDDPNDLNFEVGNLLKKVIDLNNELTKNVQERYLIPITNTIRGYVFKHELNKDQTIDRLNEIKKSIEDEIIKMADPQRRGKRKTEKEGTKVVRNEHEHEQKGGQNDTRYIEQKYRLQFIDEFTHTLSLSLFQQIVRGRFEIPFFSKFVKKVETDLTHKKQLKMFKTMVNYEILFSFLKKLPLLIDHRYIEHIVSVLKEYNDSNHLIKKYNIQLLIVWEENLRKYARDSSIHFLKWHSEIISKNPLFNFSSKHFAPYANMIVDDILKQDNLKVVTQPHYVRYHTIMEKLSKRQANMVTISEMVNTYTNHFNTFKKLLKNEPPLPAIRLPENDKDRVKISISVSENNEKVFLNLNLSDKSKFKSDILTFVLDNKSEKFQHEFEIYSMKTNSDSLIKQIYTKIASFFEITKWEEKISTSNTWDAETYNLSQLAKSIASYMKRSTILFDTSFVNSVALEERLNENRDRVVIDTKTPSYSQFLTKLFQSLESQKKTIKKMLKPDGKNKLKSINCFVFEKLWEHLISIYKNKRYRSRSAHELYVKWSIIFDILNKIYFFSIQQDVLSILECILIILIFDFIFYDEYFSMSDVKRILSHIKLSELEKEKNVYEIFTELKGKDRNKQVINPDKIFEDTFKYWKNYETRIEIKDADVVFSTEKRDRVTIAKEKYRLKVDKVFSEVRDKLDVHCPQKSLRADNQTQTTKTEGVYASLPVRHNNIGRRAATVNMTPSHKKNYQNQLKSISISNHIQLKQQKKLYDKLIWISRNTTLISNTKDKIEMILQVLFKLVLLNQILSTEHYEVKQNLNKPTVVETKYKELVDLFKINFNQFTAEFEINSDDLKQKLRNVFLHMLVVYSLHTNLINIGEKVLKQCFERVMKINKLNTESNDEVFEQIMEKMKMMRKHKGWKLYFHKGKMEINNQEYARLILESPEMVPPDSKRGALRSYLGLYKNFADKCISFIDLWEKQNTSISNRYKNQTDKLKEILRDYKETKNSDNILQKIFNLKMKDNKQGYFNSMHKIIFEEFLIFLQIQMMIAFSSKYYGVLTMEHIEDLNIKDIFNNLDSANSSAQKRPNSISHTAEKRKRPNSTNHTEKRTAKKQTVTADRPNSIQNQTSRTTH